MRTSTSTEGPAITTRTSTRRATRTQRGATPPPTEVIEGTAVEVNNVPVVPDWAGDLPVFLIFEPADGVGGNVGLDLDTAGWIEGNRETFRRPGLWFLVDKASGGPLLSLVVAEGDQFYYHRHRVGLLGETNSDLLTIHVIGKKQADGVVVRLWLFPNGMVMAGEEGEIDIVAGRMVGG
jgi:hypothetical protein